ncbi:hypothetical protein HDU96_010145, partial [Phlyctochytrium bullatum]
MAKRPGMPLERMARLADHELPLLGDDRTPVGHAMEDRMIAFQKAYPRTHEEDGGADERVVEELTQEMLNDVDEKLASGEILRAEEVDLQNLPQEVRYARKFYGDDPGQRYQMMMTDASQGDLAEQQRQALRAVPADDAERRAELLEEQRNERKEHRKQVSGDLYRHLAGITQHERLMHKMKEENAREVERLEDQDQEAKVTGGGREPVPHIASEPHRKVAPHGNRRRRRTRKRWARVRPRAKIKLRNAPIHNVGWANFFPAKGRGSVPTKRQILHCKREIPNDNQPDDGGEPQVLVLYE